MSALTIGVLRGGPSSEYDVSLETGKTILKHSPEQFRTRDILIDKAGTWHVSGFPVTPEHALRNVDAVFNALHGHYGEDGQVQQILESFKVPYTGSKPFASSMAMNKGFAKSVFQQQGIKTPYFKIISLDEFPDFRELALELYGTFPMPAILKPMAAGSSIGIQYARTLHELEEALNDISIYSNNVLIEEYIAGKELMVGVISNFRNEKLYAMLPAEVTPLSIVLDHASKHTGNFHHSHWTTVKDQEKEQAIAHAKKAFEALGLEQYGSFDFIVTPRRGIYLLETNSQPGLAEHSIFHKSLNAVGTSMQQFIEHVINLALGK